MDFYTDTRQHVTISPETPQDAAYGAIYLVTVDDTLAGRITRIQAGEWKYIRTDGSHGYARSSTLAAEALAA